jgi:hypothetical protein
LTGVANADEHPREKGTGGGTTCIDMDTDTNTGDFKVGEIAP